MHFWKNSSRLRSATKPGLVPKREAPSSYSARAPFSSVRLQPTYFRHPKPHPVLHTPLFLPTLSQASSIPTGAFHALRRLAVRRAPNTASTLSPLPLFVRPARRSKYDRESFRMKKNKTLQGLTFSTYRWTAERKEGPADVLVRCHPSRTVQVPVNCCTWLLDGNRRSGCRSNRAAMKRPNILLTGKS